jgi:hypothetical protein
MAKLNRENLKSLVALAPSLSPSWELTREISYRCLINLKVKAREIESNGKTPYIGSNLNITNRLKAGLLLS